MLLGFVISFLLASCSGGGSPGALPSSSSGSIGTNRITSPVTAPSSMPRPTASATAVAHFPAPTPTPTPVPAGSASAPDHVQSYAYYGASNVNIGIPASYMAAHTDIVEGGDATYLNAFKAAGGKTAIEYTDPSFVPYCPAPFTEPAGACTGPIGSLVANIPGAWLHDSTGARLNHYDSPVYLYQEALNPGSPAADGAFASYVNGLRASMPQLDGVFADDSGSPFEGLWWDFSSPNPVEITNDAQWIAAESAMLQAAGIKVIYNGGNNPDLGPSGPAYYSTGAPFLSLSNVIGQNREGCLDDSTEGLHTDHTPNDDYLSNDLNGLLEVQSLDKVAVCMTGSLVDVASRTYAYAAFMLIYAPSYSAFGGVTPLSDGEAVYPETQLVPQQPLTSATTDVSVLLHGGVYVREFAACSIAKVSIGACAAIVNSSSSSAAIPSLTQQYTRHIVLPANSLYGGGVATAASGAPTSLAAASAVILVQ